MLANELGPVFTHLFQLFLDTGETHKEWLVTKICPLLKKGDMALAFNYWPVSLTCAPCKLNVKKIAFGNEEHIRD